jgi:hypothetical protein
MQELLEKIMKPPPMDPTDLMDLTDPIEAMRVG